ncbi:CBS domain-containing protein [Natronolimnohabitans innermongolicus]|uniref:Signal transduction protein with CBS domains n=1 Tax=Natronolimnohabitans innermongolicus JCM 12255 TaxID=1227499 RepID=L9WXA7_9EURY|nr:CBS domain-containing protein [Natronolimnohabitans innermongolicus]ELY53836.1 signal transduction protein with CBS domains [Natronolimnohabitans innermongolicus JCM 12255]
MQDIFVARIMSSTVHSVESETLVEDAAGSMLDNEIGSVVVTDENNHLEGILTTTDFVRIVAERKPKDQTPVERYMSEDVITVSAQDGIRDAADVMVDHGFHHLPVVDEDEGVIGMITTSDLASYLSREEAPSPE